MDSDVRPTSREIRETGRPCLDLLDFYVGPAEYPIPMARLERLCVYPVKSLDGVDLDSARITEGGVLEYDREYALFDAEGDPITGRRVARVHDLDAAFDPETRVLTVRASGGGDGGGERRFHLDDERDAAAAWFGDFFDTAVTIRHDAVSGFVDRPEAGPSVVSTATIREVSTWFDDVSVDGLRRRIRANVEVGGVPAFWEDRFVGAGAPMFAVGDVRFEGVEPCIRCGVPERDPGTGERTPDFRKRFVERRRATFPAWADRSAFPSDYTLMLIARVPPTDRGRTLHVGDEVTVEAG